MRLIGLGSSAISALAWATVATLPAGCVGSGSDDSLPEIVDPHSAEVIDSAPLSSCTRDVSSADVTDNVQITFDFEISAHEMIACGGLVFSIVGALVDGLVDMAEDPSSTTLPDQYTFDGEGTYFIEPDTFDDLRMEVRFRLGREYSLGGEGELVTENLFLLSSYLVDPRATVTIDTSSGLPEVTVEIEHAGPGPLVELLGLGTDPPSPIVVTDDTLLDAQAHLRDLQVETIIFFSDHPGVSTVEYDVESPRMLADSFLTGAPMELSMVGADGWRDDLGQNLDVDTWTIEYADDVGALEGDIVFTTRGGHFDYVSQLHYDRSGWPTIELECAE